jgi:hypothetical protein
LIVTHSQQIMEGSSVPADAKLIHVTDEAGPSSFVIRQVPAGDEKLTRVTEEAGPFIIRPRSNEEMPASRAQDHGTTNHNKRCVKR